MFIKRITSKKNYFEYKTLKNKFDINITTISTLVSYHYNAFHKNSLNHINPLISSCKLLDNSFRRFKCKWKRDLLNNQ